MQIVAFTRNAIRNELHINPGSCKDVNKSMEMYPLEKAIGSLELKLDQYSCQLPLYLTPHLKVRDEGERIN